MPHSSEYKSEIFNSREIAPGIIETSVLDHATFDIQDVWEAKKINNEISGGQPYAYLGVLGEFSVVTEEAKKLMASKEIIGNTVAKALLIQSLSDRILANFYLKVTRPILKTKVFTNREKAISWLKSELVKCSKNSLLQD